MVQIPVHRHHGSARDKSVALLQGTPTTNSSSCSLVDENAGVGGVGGRLRRAPFGSGVDGRDLEKKHVGSLNCSVIDLFLVPFSRLNIQ